MTFHILVASAMLTYLPQVSVIMPAFNAAQFISRAIESVIDQSFRNWELIIVNDGSSDNTEEIIKNFLIKEHRIRYVFQTNGKQGKARNHGLRMAQGKYIAFLDADDIWISDKLATQIKQIESEDVNLVFSDFGLINEKDEITKNSVGVEGDIVFSREHLNMFFEQNRIPILTVLVEKNAIEKCGFFSEEPFVQNAEDYHLWLKMLIANCKFRSFGNVFAYYRIHSQQNTNADFLATRSVLNALILLEVYDDSIITLQNEAIYRWLLRYFYVESKTTDHIKPVYRYLSSQSLKFKMINTILPLFNSRWQNRLVSRFCKHKLSRIHG